MATEQDEIGPHDMPTTKTFPVGDVNITAIRKDPFGFWYLKSDKGDLPVKYQGAYTSMAEIEKAIKDYSNSLKQEEEAKKKQEEEVKTKKTKTSA